MQSIARSCPPSRLLVVYVSFEDSKNTPEFETALQLDLQYRRWVETESTGLLDSEVNYKGHNTR